MAHAVSGDAIIERRFAAFLDEQVWVCWSEIERKGKRVKLPVSPVNGRAASVAQCKTWVRYAQAKAFRRKAGVGLVLTLTQHGRLIGIDLDTCRHPETGAIASWAVAIIDAMASYTEISPSGTGFKIFAVMAEQDWQRARLLLSADMNRLGASWKSAGDHHPPGVELYLGGRYFTVTGLEHGTRAVREIASEDLSRIIRLCEQTFKKEGPTFMKAGSRSRALPRHPEKGLDQTESGRAFRACLAAVREGVPMEQVPEWAARLAKSPEHADRAVSDEYWMRRRNDGTQLERDYYRALAIAHKGRNGSDAS